MLYFDQIFQGVVQPWVAPVLAVALLLWALVTFFQFRHELSAPYESVLSAVKLIGKTDGAAGFARDFETLNEKLSADPVLVILAHVMGTADQELLARNEYLAAENRIMKAQLKGRQKLPDGEVGITHATASPA